MKTVCLWWLQHTQINSRRKDETGCSFWRAKPWCGIWCMDKQLSGMTGNTVVTLPNNPCKVINRAHIPSKIPYSNSFILWFDHNGHVFLAPAKLMHFDPVSYHAWINQMLSISSPFQGVFFNHHFISKKTHPCMHIYLFIYFFFGGWGGPFYFIIFAEGIIEGKKSLSLMFLLLFRFYIWEKDLSNTLSSRTMSRTVLGYYKIPSLQSKVRFLYRFLIWAETFFLKFIQRLSYPHLFYNFLAHIVCWHLSRLCLFFLL